MVGDFEARRTSFGARASEYDRVRPGYPDAAIRAVIGDRPSRVLDIGAGTGRLAARCSALGSAALAVEPDPGMAGIAGRVVPDAVVRATAEQLPLSDASVDAIVVGQAWHWFAAETAALECGRVLRSGGCLGVFRNVRDESESWVAALGDIIGGEDRSRSRSFSSEAIELGGPFQAGEHEDFAHRHGMAPDDLVSLALTHSYVATHPEAARLIAQVTELVRSHPDLVGRERIEVPYICRLTRAIRL